PARPLFPYTTPFRSTGLGFAQLGMICGDVEDRAVSVAELGRDERTPDGVRLRARGGQRHVQGTHRGGVSPLGEQLGEQLELARGGDRLPRLLPLRDPLGDGALPV